MRLVGIDLLRVVGREPVLLFATVVASPPTAIALGDVGNDGVLAEEQLVVVLVVVVVQRLHCHLVTGVTSRVPVSTTWHRRHSTRPFTGLVDNYVFFRWDLSLTRRE